MNPGPIRDALDDFEYEYFEEEDGFRVVGFYRSIHPELLAAIVENGAAITLGREMPFEGAPLGYEIVDDDSI